MNGNNGIIQQVLDKYYNCMMASDFTKMKQELIEEIRKDIQTLWLEFNCDSYSARTILKSLIGDNQQ